MNSVLEPREDKPPDSPKIRPTIVIKTKSAATEKCKCGKMFEPFKHKQGFSKSCPSCLEKSRERERTRAPRPHRVDRRDPIKRQRWKMLNHDKMAECWLKHRQNKKKELGIEEYRKKESEYAAQWRAKNPDKNAAIIERLKNSTASRLSSMKYQAEKKGVDWFLTDGYATRMINHPCFYCNSFIKGVKNSIDKMCNKGCYTISNCVSCCQICNFMKEALDIITMLYHINNILFHHGKVPDSCDSVNFDVKYVDYSAYRWRANEKGLEFALTPEQFKNIKRDPCYLCGVKNTATHQNGIDRVDSAKGYTLDNCKSCCGLCNYFKGTMGFDEFIEHITTIHGYREKIIRHAALIKKLGDTESNGYYELNSSKVDEMLENLTESDLDAVRTIIPIKRMKERNPRKLNDTQIQELSKQRKQKALNKQLADLDDAQYIHKRALANGAKRMKLKLDKHNDDLELIDKLEKIQQELDSLNNG